MSIRFLEGMNIPFVTGLDDPILSTDAVNKAYVEMVSIPLGGTTGQCLKKISANNYDVEWANCDGALSGGFASIHGGFFTSPNNAIIHGGFF